MITIIEANILTAQTKYIAHQTNCISKSSAGVAKCIFTKFPYADTYKNRLKADKLGTIKIMGDGKEQRYVINMNAQVYPGPSNKDNSGERLEAFDKCLSHIADIPELESIAFPFNIGCGLAGGNWEHYLIVLEKFAVVIEKSQNAKTYLFKL